MPPFLTAVVSISTLIRCGLASSSEPMIIPLRRESVPVKRKGQVVSFKTSYSGVISLGNPAQPFRAVFDTGSGHVVVPSIKCDTPSCLVHERFDLTTSETSVPINADGSVVPDGELCDHVDIGFGTGTITGEFVRDHVCFGYPEGSNHDFESEQMQSNRSCFEMNVVMAVKMSTHPFKSFNFDGIVGLGLHSLALSDDFSFFDTVVRSGAVQSPNFAVYLTEGDVEGEESELAVGGWNEKRALRPITWSPVVTPDLGYWQVRILAVRVDGKELDVCRDGTCRGVVDTGTSHLGIPAPHDQEVAGLLTVDAGDLEDCRLARTPTIEIVLESYTISLNAENYMRKLPLSDDVNVGSATGVVMPAEQNHTLEGLIANSEEETNASRFRCRPKLMPVNLPEPVGPKIFILGEPVLHRYYTVYNWEDLQVGFSLANTHQNKARVAARIAQKKQHFLAQSSSDGVFLMQQSLDVHSHDEDDEMLFVQVKMCVNIRSV